MSLIYTQQILISDQKNSNCITTKPIPILTCHFCASLLDHWAEKNCHVYPITEQYRCLSTNISVQHNNTHSPFHGHLLLTTGKCRVIACRTECRVWLRWRWRDSSRKQGSAAFPLSALMCPGVPALMECSNSFGSNMPMLVE